MSEWLWVECCDMGTRLGASPMGLVTFKEKGECVNCAAVQQNLHGPTQDGKTTQKHFNRKTKNHVLSSQLKGNFTYFAFLFQKLTRTI